MSRKTEKKTSVLPSAKQTDVSHLYPAHERKCNIYKGSYYRLPKKAFHKFPTTPLEGPILQYRIVIKSPPYIL